MQQTCQHDQASPPHSRVAGKVIDPTSRSTPAVIGASSAPSRPVDQKSVIHMSIVSNSKLLRDGLIPLLTPRLDFLLVGSYAGDPPTSTLLPCPMAHVALLDAGMGEQRTLRWIQHWCATQPRTQVLVFDLIDDIQTILTYIEAGAGGYTLQGASSVELVSAIDQIQRGCAECSPEVTARLFERLASLRTALKQSPAPLAQLTVRELEVLRYIAADYSNQQIADQLVIEIRTVKHHVHNILEKLKLQRRWEAARLALEQGWVSSDTLPAPEQACD